MHMRKAEPQVDKTEILANLGVIAAGIIGMFAGYFTKKSGKTLPSQDTVVASVDLEFGNRMQRDEMNSQLKRIADSLAILADRERADIKDALEDLLERIPDRR